MSSVPYLFGLPVTAQCGSVPPTLDPGHEFVDVVEQLGGADATYRAGGPYPAITNGGYVANYAAPRRCLATVFALKGMTDYWLEGHLAPYEHFAGDLLSDKLSAPNKALTASPLPVLVRQAPAATPFRSGNRALCRDPTQVPPRMHRCCPR